MRTSLKRIDQRKLTNNQRYERIINCWKIVRKLKHTPKGVELQLEYAGLQRESKENKKVLIQKEKEFLNQIPDKEYKPQFIRDLQTLKRKKAKKQNRIRMSKRTPTRNCVCCKMGVIETQKHILSNCKAYNKIYIRLISQLSKLISKYEIKKLQEWFSKVKANNSESELSELIFHILLHRKVPNWDNNVFGKVKKELHEKWEKIVENVKTSIYKYRKRLIDKAQNKRKQQDPWNLTQYKALTQLDNGLKETMSNIDLNDKLNEKSIIKKNTINIKQTVPKQIGIRDQTQLSRKRTNIEHLILNDANRSRFHSILGNV